MNHIQIERLVRTNEKQNITVKQYVGQIQCLKNDLLTYQQVAKKQESQIEALKRQIENLNKKLQFNRFEREQTQSRFYRVLSKLEEQLDQRKKKYEKLQSKIAPLVDHDSVRLKILSQVQYSHQVDLQKEKRVNEGLKDAILKLKRENMLLKHKIQSQKLQYEDIVKRVQQENKSKSNSWHIDAMSYEMGKEIQQKLRKNLQQAREEAEYYKDRYFAIQKKYQQRK